MSRFRGFHSSAWEFDDLPGNTVKNSFKRPRQFEDLATNSNAYGQKPRNYENGLTEMELFSVECRGALRELLEDLKILLCPRHLSTKTWAPDPDNWKVTNKELLAVDRWRALNE